MKNVSHVELSQKNIIIIKFNNSLNFKEMKYISLKIMDTVNNSFRKSKHKEQKFLLIYNFTLNILWICKFLTLRKFDNGLVQLWSYQRN